MMWLGAENKYDALAFVLFLETTLEFCVAQTGSQHAIPLLASPECWDHRHVSPHFGIGTSVAQMYMLLLFLSALSFSGLVDSEPRGECSMKLEVKTVTGHPKLMNQQAAGGFRVGWLTGSDYQGDVWLLFTMGTPLLGACVTAMYSRAR